ncbi:MAG TPA: response regulator [Polyangiales bacterium]
MSPGRQIVVRPARILIVDDDDANREVLAIILAHEGFLTAAADCGREALMAAAEQSPDLILLDVMMPDMSGYEVAMKLKGDPSTRHIVICMITALSDRATRLRALNAGADFFLSKPLDRGVLCAHVKSLLGNLVHAA